MKNAFTLLFSLLTLCSFSQENFIDPEMKNLVHSESRSSNNGGSRSSGSGEFDIKYIKAEFNVQPTVDTIQGGVQTSFEVTKKTMDTLRYDFTSDPLMSVSFVYIDGKINTNFYRLNDELIIPLKTSMAVGQKATSLIIYAGKPARIFGARGFFYSGNSRFGDKAFWTMSEPYAAKYWWPCKMDLYDKADSLDITLIHPQEYHAAAPGLMVSRDSIANNLVQTRWKHNYPIVNYLVAIAVGEYTVTSSTLNYRGKQLHMEDYLYKSENRWADSTKRHLEPTFALFDSLFGAYPFEKEKYGHAQYTRGGGMEHQTMSFMQDLNQPLVAHELAHQWFGNKVTCGSWQDLWLNESFATYLTALTHEAGFGDMDWMDWKRSMISTVTWDSTGSVWVNDTNNFNRLFSSRLTYIKGAYVLHMLRHECGDKAFFEGARNYLNDPKLAYGFARTKDLKRHMEAASKLDLTEFLDDWFYGEGNPDYELTWKINANNIILKLDQTPSHSSVSFFEMDVPIALYKDGKREDILFHHTKSGETLVKSIRYKPDSVLIDPDLWILTRGKTVVEGIHENVSVESYKKGNGLLVYPNPANDVLNINALEKIEGKLVIEIFDQLGKRVLATEMNSDLNETQLDISHLNAGIYQLKTTNENQISHNRFVVGR